jgi:hypothetical protein
VNPSPDLPTAALEYAERGWTVIPLHSSAAHGCSCRRAECESPAKHPRTAHGLKDASRDAETIREWWTRWPDANIGIATGQPSGVFVVDVDGEAGRASVAELKRQGLTFPHTLTVITGRAGGETHFYYRMPPGVDVRNDQSGKIGPHIDARGTGGFVVAAGSTHASGKVYHFVEPSATIADAPAWVIERLTAHQTKPRATAQASRDAVTKGSRTSTLVSAAGTMQRRGMSAQAISAALVMENKAKCSPPLPESKVRSIAADIAKRYPAGGPDILEAAMEVIEGGTYRSHTDRFGALCAVLQRLRGHEPVILPVERIARAFACHWTLIARLRRQAVAAGWLIPERRAIAHRQAASFRVLSETVAPGMYHENEKETVEERDEQHSDTSLSNTGDCLSEIPGFSETDTLPLDASIFSLE